MTDSPRDVKLAFLAERKTAFSLAFMNAAGQAVLDDLRPFCRADSTCFDPDPRVHAALEGRREVWLRIQDHINLSPEALLAKYDRSAPKG